MKKYTAPLLLQLIIAATLISVTAASAADNNNEPAAPDSGTYTRPNSNFEFGLLYGSSDAPLFGLYNGLNDQGIYGLLGVSLNKRDEDTGTWLTLSGRNIGLDSRELRFEHNRQGNWAYYLEYSRTPRVTPYTISTGLAGIGTATQTINGAPLADVELSTARDSVTLGFSKFLPAGWDIQAHFKNEKKEGARLWGQGGGGTVNFLTDPINQTTQQLDLTLGFSGEKLHISSGYYGTLFNNHSTVLNVPNSTVFTQMALPPGNHSHQLYLSGGYSFTPSTQGTFKFARTRAFQKEDFFVAPTNNTRTNLGGAVDTTLLQMGITAYPLPKLSLLANVRHEDKDDKTPLVLYTVVSNTSTLDGKNEPRSIRSLVGKMEASYALPINYRITGGVDYDEKKRNMFRVASVSQRARTDEISYRLELRRVLSETITGALAYIQSDRGGSAFMTNVLNNPVVTPGSNLIAPIHLADRKREKVRLSANWQATEQWSIQFRADQAHDHYSQREGSILGAQTGRASAYAIDTTYAFNDEWQVTAWVSRDDTRFTQLTRTTPWQANLRNVGVAYGTNVRGTLVSGTEVGADMSYSDIREENQQQALAGTAVDTIPAISTTLTNLNLFAMYALNNQTDVRINYIYDRYRTDDWTWTAWTYSDGTQVRNDPTQTVHFIGLMMRYRFQ